MLIGGRNAISRVKSAAGGKPDTRVREKLALGQASAATLDSCHVSEHPVRHVDGRSGSQVQVVIDELYVHQWTAIFNCVAKYIGVLNTQQWTVR